MGTSRTACVQKASAYSLAGLPLSVALVLSACGLTERNRQVEGITTAGGSRGDTGVSGRTAGIGGLASSSDTADTDGSDSAAGGSSGGVGGTGSDASGATGGGSAGEPGTGGIGTNDNPWRQSEDPFCMKDEAAGWYESADLWSDETGVYLMIGSHLYENRGTGWALLSDNARGGPGGVSGFVDGPLLRYGNTARCGIELVDRGGRDTCSGAMSAPAHVHVVNDTLAFAAEGDRLYAFDGQFWMLQDTQHALDGAWIQQLWANEGTLLIAADSGVYLSRGGEVPLLQAMPMSSESSAVSYNVAWGFSADELWVGSSTGQLLQFFDGVWSIAWEGDDQTDCRAIQHIWGGNGELFFITLNGLYVWRAGNVETLAKRACDAEDGAKFWGLWGNSADEVFVVERGAAPSGACGDILVSWFDGETLGRL